GAASLSSRAIIGMFYRKLTEVTGASWTGKVAMGPFESDQDSETYNWIGMVPQLREWVGGRQAKGFLENGITIINKMYESTLQILTKDLRRDKTGQLQVRIGEQAKRANSHWAKLLSTLILNGASTVCYDGQFFFDTDHDEGDSGTQSNDITNSIVLKTAPTAAEMEQAILDCIVQIMGFKDDTGEPMNEEAAEFLVLVPTVFMKSAMAAVNNPVIVDSNGSRTNTIAATLGGFSISVQVNARLTWTDKFAVFRTDTDTGAFIRQEEQGVQVDAIAEGSELEFNEKKHHYGVSALRNVGYGFWQRACLKTFTTT
ncbi:Mu-like prophage major head subunit gpT family protein, partial [Candidatus Pacearchaeota archaeon]|nr:Mu-like prophage major head subunit gpT family protein [Candidatus Pacearchaeota archaeon]